MLFFGTLFCLSYKIGMGELSVKKYFSKPDIFIAIFFCLTAFLVTVWLLRQNQFVYYWDYGGYWTLSYTQADKIFQNPSEAFKELYNSICYNDYNYLLPTLIALPLKIFGYSFTRYVLLCEIIFLFPTFFLISALCIKLINIYHITKITVNKHFQCLLICSVVFTFNTFYIATFQGYIDAATLIPVTLCMLIIVDYEPTKIYRKQIFRDIFISFNLLAAFLFRRYFSFFILGYAVSLILNCIYSIYSEKSVNIKKAAINVIINLSITGGVALSILLIFFFPLVRHIITTNYSLAYSAYNISMRHSIFSAFSYFGYLIVILSSVAVILALIKRKLRKITLICFISVITESLLFFRVQYMGQQHIYIIAVQLCLLTFMAFLHILAFNKIGKCKILSIILCLFLVYSSTLNCFFPKVRPFFKNIKVLFSSEYNAFVRNDIQVLHEICDYVNSISTPQNKSVYTLASGNVLNNGIWDSLNKPYGTNPLINSLPTADVDLRDGFPTDFLSAGIIITTVPIQLHLRSGSQEVVRFLHQELTNPDSPIGKHFEKDPAVFELDDGVIVNIYIKKSDFDNWDLKYISNYFSKYYPGQNELFSDRILSFAKDDK